MEVAGSKAALRSEANVSNVFVFADLQAINIGSEPTRVSRSFAMCFSVWRGNGARRVNDARASEPV